MADTEMTVPNIPNSANKRPLEEEEEEEDNETSGSLATTTTTTTPTTTTTTTKRGGKKPSTSSPAAKKARTETVVGKKKSGVVKTPVRKTKPAAVRVKGEKEEEEEEEKKKKKKNVEVAKKTMMTTTTMNGEVDGDGGEGEGEGDYGNSKGKEKGKGKAKEMEKGEEKVIQDSTEAVVVTENLKDGVDGGVGVGVGVGVDGDTEMKGDENKSEGTKPATKKSDAASHLLTFWRDHVSRKHSPKFEFDQNEKHDTWGCALHLFVPPASTRTFTQPTVYPSKKDAKDAAVKAALKSGVFEAAAAAAKRSAAIKNRGKQPTPGGGGGGGGSGGQRERGGGKGGGRGGGGATADGGHDVKADGESGTGIGSNVQVGNDPVGDGKPQAVPQLYQITTRYLGANNAPQFEYSYDGETQTHSATLTVNIHSGLIKTYSTVESYRTIKAAKESVARIAVADGLLDLIAKEQSIEAKKARGEVPVGAGSEGGGDEFGENVAQHLNILANTMLGKHNLFYDYETSPEGRFGATVKIKLGYNNHRTFVVPPRCTSKKQARREVARIAIDNKIAEEMQKVKDQRVNKRQQGRGGPGQFGGAGASGGGNNVGGTSGKGGLVGKGGVGSRSQTPKQAVKSDVQGKVGVQGLKGKGKEVEGDGKSEGKKKTLPPAGSLPDRSIEGLESGVAYLNSCFHAWLGGTNTLTWEYELTATGKHGATLHLRLSPLVTRKYRVAPKYGSKREAKEALAKHSIRQGILLLVKPKNTDQPLRPGRAGAFALAGRGTGRGGLLAGRGNALAVRGGRGGVLAGRGGAVMGRPGAVGRGAAPATRGGVGNRGTAATTLARKPFANRSVTFNQPPAQHAQPPTAPFAMQQPQVSAAGQPGFGFQGQRNASPNRFGQGPPFTTQQPPSNIVPQPLMGAPGGFPNQPPIHGQFPQQPPAPYGPPPSQMLPQVPQGGLPQQLPQAPQPFAQQPPPPQGMQQSPQPYGQQNQFPTQNPPQFNQPQFPPQQQQLQPQQPPPQQPPPQQQSSPTPIQGSFGNQGSYTQPASQPPVSFVQQGAQAQPPFGQPPPPQQQSFQPTPTTQPQSFNQQPQPSFSQPPSQPSFGTQQPQQPPFGHHPAQQQPSFGQQQQQPPQQQQQPPYGQQQTQQPLNQSQPTQNQAPFAGQHSFNQSQSQNHSDQSGGALGITGSSSLSSSTPVTQSFGSQAVGGSTPQAQPSAEKINKPTPSIVDQLDDFCDMWMGQGHLPQYEPRRDERTGLYGCLMRIPVTPGNVKTFWVSSDFKARQEAQEAVARIAMSENIYNTIKQEFSKSNQPQPSQLGTSSSDQFNSGGGNLSVTRTNSPSFGSSSTQNNQFGQPAGGPQRATSFGSNHQPPSFNQPPPSSQGNVNVGQQSSGTNNAGLGGSNGPPSANNFPAVPGNLNANAGVNNNLFRPNVNAPGMNPIGSLAGRGGFNQQNPMNRPGNQGFGPNANNPGFPGRGRGGPPFRGQNRGTPFGPRGGMNGGPGIGRGMNMGTPGQSTSTPNSFQAPGNNFQQSNPNFQNPQNKNFPRPPAQNFQSPSNNNFQQGGNQSFAPPNQSNAFPGQPNQNFQTPPNPNLQRSSNPNIQTSANNFQTPNNNNNPFQTSSSPGFQGSPTGSSFQQGGNPAFQTANASAPFPGANSFPGQNNLQGFQSQQPPSAQQSQQLSGVQQPQPGSNSKSDSAVAVLKKTCQSHLGNEPQDLPEYEFITDSTGGNYGAAVHVNLNQDQTLSYHVPSTWSNKREAKDAVARLAIDQGALTMIKESAEKSRMNNLSVSYPGQDDTYSPLKIGPKADRTRPKTTVHQLQDFCRSNSMPNPVYTSETGPGDVVLRVWLVIGDLRFELDNIGGKDLKTAKEKLASRVLKHLQKEEADKRGA